MTEKQCHICGKIIDDIAYWDNTIWCYCLDCFNNIVLDNPKQEEYMKKRLIEALEDLPKPKKTGYLMMTPNEDKIEKIKSFSNDEISFKRDLPHEFGFKRRNND